LRRNKFWRTSQKIVFSGDDNDRSKIIGMDMEIFTRPLGLRKKTNVLIDQLYILLMDNNSQTFLGQVSMQQLGSTPMIVHAKAWTMKKLYTFDNSCIENKELYFE
jgi:hypothetical protein